MLKKVFYITDKGGYGGEGMIEFSPAKTDKDLPATQTTIAPNTPRDRWNKKKKAWVTPGLENLEESRTINVTTNTVKVSQTEGGEGSSDSDDSMDVKSVNETTQSEDVKSKSEASSPNSKQADATDE